MKNGLEEVHADPRIPTKELLHIYVDASIFDINEQEETSLTEVTAHKLEALPFNFYLNLNEHFCEEEKI